MLRNSCHPESMFRLTNWTRLHPATRTPTARSLFAEALLSALPAPGRVAEHRFRSQPQDALRPGQPHKAVQSTAPTAKGRSTLRGKRATGRAQRPLHQNRRCSKATSRQLGSQAEFDPRNRQTRGPLSGKHEADRLPAPATVAKDRRTTRTSEAHYHRRQQGKGRDKNITHRLPRIPPSCGTCTNGRLQAISVWTATPHPVRWKQTTDSKSQAARVKIGHGPGKPFSWDRRTSRASNATRTTSYRDTPQLMRRLS